MKKRKVKITEKRREYGLIACVICGFVWYSFLTIMALIDPLLLRGVTPVALGMVAFAFLWMSYDFTTKEEHWKNKTKVVEMEGYK